jgi:MatE
MGPEACEEDVEEGVSTRTEHRSHRASFGAVYDDISVSLPPPAVGLMLPASTTNHQASDGLWSPEFDSSSEDHIAQDETRKDSPGTTTARTMSTEGASMRRFPTNHNEPSETTALLTSGTAHPSPNFLRNVSTAKDGDENEGKVETTWKTECLILTKYSLPLMLTCVLQYSLSGASVIAVGHLGKTELGSVSLAIMTSNVTGYCVYAGLATSLDTLCAQAYGSGKPYLVGLQLQRMVYFLWIVTVPIAAIWFSGTQILLLITPERECAELAGLFLKVLVAGAPGFALFEAGKRFVQAQGLFNANLYVLLLCAPVNAFMNWLFVWVRHISRSNLEER